MLQEKIDSHVLADWYKETPRAVSGAQKKDLDGKAG
jgi:hypothetical protein